MPPTSTYTTTEDIDSDLTDIEDDDESEDELQEEEQGQVTVKKHSTPLPSSTSTSKPISRPIRSSTRKPKKEPTPEEEEGGPDLDTPINRPMPCMWLYNEMASGRIDLDPEYQRDVVWNDLKQSSLIDSILNHHTISQIIFGGRQHDLLGLGSRVPPILFLCTSPTYNVPILRFMSGEVSIFYTKNDVHLTVTPLPRYVAPLQKPINSKTSRQYWWTSSDVKGRRELPENLRQRFLSAAITCLDYKHMTDDNERDLFSRIQNGTTHTCAERLQAKNGPHAALIRKMKHLVNSAFTTNVNWGKGRGRDFQITAQALYLIEFSLESNKMPAQPTVAQMDKWLNPKAQMKEQFRRRAHEVIAMLTALVQDPKLGEPFSMAKYSKFSAMEFMITVYMITIFAGVFSMERLSVAVGCIRKSAQDHGGARFNSTTYKHLVRYVRKGLEDDVFRLSGTAPQTSAQEYWEKKVASKEQATHQEVKKEIKKEVKKEAKKGTKAKVDKGGDVVMEDDTQGEDSDVPLIKRRKRKSTGCDGGVDEDDVPKPAKAKRKLDTSASTSATKQEAKPKEKVATKGSSKETLVQAPKRRLDNFGRIPKTISSSTSSKSQTPLSVAPAPSSATAPPKASAKKPVIAPIDTKIASGSASKQVASRSAKPGPSSSSSMMQSESMSRLATPQSQLSQTPASATFPENPPIRTIQQDIMSGASLSGPRDVARPSPSGSMSPLTPVPPSMSTSTSLLGRGRPTGNERSLSSSSSRLANLRAARGASMSTSTFTTTPTPTPTPTTDPRLRSKSTGTTSGAGSTVAQPDTARSTVSAQPQWLALSNEIYKSFQDVSLSSTSEVPSTQPPSSSLPPNSRPPQTAQNQRSPALPPTAPRADRGRTVSAHQSGLAPQPGHRYHPYQRQESPPRLLKSEESGEVCASPKPLMPKDEELPVSRLPTPPLSAGLPTKPSYDHWEPEVDRYRHHGERDHWQPEDGRYDRSRRFSGSSSYRPSLRRY
ncbi:hypothetical protein VNI00_010078 [Paramarasmius palmivorus]|uniref:DUF262 domain-containing protein n=1 Tax=Paramarasmius palmivorus TaxID=297713 RepID=A0AAW0CMG1_9AGAR